MVERLRDRAHLPPADSRITRREFVDLSLKTALALALTGCRPRDDPELKMNSPDKLLFTTDKHVGDYDTSIRQANSESADSLRQVFSLLPKNLPYDDVFDFGDNTIDSADEQVNINNFIKSIRPYTKLSKPGEHLLGNHDIWNITLDNLSKTYKKEGFSGEFYGVKQFRNFQVVWLDLESKAINEEYLPEGRVEWMKKVIHPDTPTIIFTHKPLMQMDVENNEYFKRKKQESLLVNGPEVWQEIKHLPIRAVISGHLHPVGGFVYRKEENTHMIALPSFVERINGKNPAVITVFKADEKNLSLKAHSRGKVIYELFV